jgi:hypothetical protein
LNQDSALIEGLRFPVAKPFMAKGICRNIPREFCRLWPIQGISPRLKESGADDSLLWIMRPYLID